MRIINRITFLLVLLFLLVPTADAQACGGAFNPIEVSDSSGQNIPGVTIEIIARLPREKYNNVKYRFGKAVRISAKAAETAVKRRLPMHYTEDMFCGNPLKQIAGLTKVRKIGEQQPPSVENFGFCTGETFSVPFVLKVSAPGYLTDYYIGSFLGGCGVTYKVVLIKREK